MPLDVLDKAIMTKPVNLVVDMDIEKFFDTIDHKWLMRGLQKRIADPRFLQLIGRFLNSGIMEEGKYIKTDRGTPQGGVVSPVLANIYLHYVLDLWFEKEFNRQLKGFAQSCLCVACLCVSARRQLIDLLGFTHYCDKTRRGKFKLGRKTARMKFRQRMKAMNQWLKGVRNLVELKEWWKVLKQKLVGHYNYYGISGNMQGIRKFYRATIRLVYKWINRRSRKRSHDFERFCRFLKHNPLSEPKIYHLIYTLSSL